MVRRKGRTRSGQDVRFTLRPLFSIAGPSWTLSSPRVTMGGGLDQITKQSEIVTLKICLETNNLKFSVSWFMNSSFKK